MSVPLAKGEAVQPVLHIDDATSCGRHKKIREDEADGQNFINTLLHWRFFYKKKKNLD